MVSGLYLPHRDRDEVPTRYSIVIIIICRLGIKLLFLLGTGLKGSVPEIWFKITQWIINILLLWI